MLMWGSRSSAFLLGRWSAAALVVFVGAVLLWDQVKGRNDISLLGEWWPALLIIIGLEVTAYSLMTRRRHRRLLFDVAGVFVAFLIASTAFVITQYGGLPFRWLDQWNTGIAGIGNLGEEKGYEYTKNDVTAVPEQKVKTVVIDNPNGEIKVMRGSGSSVVVKTVVWIDLENKQEADKIAGESEVKIASGEQMVIEAKGKPYGANGERKPRMNITVLLPENTAAVETVSLGEAPGGVSPESGVPDGVPDHPSGGNLGGGALQGDNEIEGSGISDAGNVLNGTGSSSPSGSGQERDDVEMKVNAGNGPVTISGFRLAAGLTVNNVNGLINIRDITGSVSAHTIYGDITANAITGDAKLSAKDGNVYAKGIGGNLSASTSNGSLELSQIDGNTEAGTKNGKISINEVRGNVQADTLNGEIDLASAVVEGSWDVDSSIGDIHIRLPESGDYSVYGSVTFGSISSDLPLANDSKTIEGTIGLGTYRINVDANSDIAINRYTSPSG
ncbi:DUF4097 family beta strand repeat-containing protein [Paenibacillus beijingensis]|uniref:DUF4097 domain-containing protein n=1 Tax=Paenibacillus beijingensis TaxID=1126833 RepID=A0A0D5NEM5_9BACL|nr:DUF4097 family beta strand repeat-containing protein [Paenibacillus beijingensis]AJY73834.1 hypothetical protein VN24_03395 [Paenibacillus beijingensis]